jgi:hypothetical protein
MIKEEFTEEFTLCDDDLTMLLRKLLFDGGKVIAEIKTDDLDINCFKVKIKKEK